MAIYATETAIPQMTSNNTPSGVAGASTSYSATYNPWKAFNRTNSDVNDCWASTTTNAWIQYEFSELKVIGKYSITNRNVGNTNYIETPKDWTFEGSNDGINWTVLDTVSNNPSWSSVQTRDYSVDNRIAFKYYRLHVFSVHSGSIVTIGKLEMFELIYEHKILFSSNSKTYSITPPIYATETAIPKMTSNTTPSGKVFASSAFGTSNSAWKAFDNVSGYWATASGTPLGHIGYEFISRKIIGKYVVKNDSVNRTPRNWVFEGSNDGTDWIALDNQSNQVWGTPNTSGSTFDKEFIINKPEFYLMYRLNITETNSTQGYTCIEEIKMYELIAPESLKILPNQSEQTFLNHGMESPINFTQFNGTKSIESNSTIHESGKKFTHSVDLSKRRVDKIILS